MFQNVMNDRNVLHLRFITLTCWDTLLVKPLGKIFLLLHCLVKSAKTAWWPQMLQGEPNIKKKKNCCKVESFLHWDGHILNQITTFKGINVISDNQALLFWWYLKQLFSFLLDLSLAERIHIPYILHHLFQACIPSNT